MDISVFITGFAMIFSSIGFWTFVQHIIDKKSKRTQISTGLAYLGIKMSCKTILDKGWADPEEIEDIEKYLYDPYKAMGGNGMAEMMMNKVKALPTKPPKEV